MEWLANISLASYVAVTVLATLILLPGSVTMTLAGFLFGLMPGALAALVAIPLGAQAAFLVGRWLGRPWVERRMDSAPRWRALDRALADDAFAIVALSRLSLVVPFNVFNYVCGASGVKATTYFAATTIGMLPAIALYVYLGTLAQSIGQVIAGESTPAELSWWLMGAGVVLLIVLISMVRRTARRALDKYLHSEESQSSNV